MRRRRDSVGSQEDYDRCEERQRRFSGHSVSTSTNEGRRRPRPRSHSAKWDPGRTWEQQQQQQQPKPPRREQQPRVKAAQQNRRREPRMKGRRQECVTEAPSTIRVVGFRSGTTVEELLRHLSRLAPCQEAVLCAYVEFGSKKRQVLSESGGIFQLPNGSKWLLQDPEGEPPPLRMQAPPVIQEWPLPFENSSSFVLDPATGLYYDEPSRFYYNAQQSLYYSCDRKVYYHYSKALGFHEVAPPDSRQPNEANARTSLVDKMPSGESIARIRVEPASDKVFIKATPAQDKNTVSAETTIEKISIKASKRKRKSDVDPKLGTDLILAGNSKLITHKVKTDVHVPATAGALNEPVEKGGPNMTAKASAKKQKIAEKDISKWKKGQDSRRTSAMLQYKCQLCRRKFVSQEKLERHIQHSRLHKSNLEGKSSESRYRDRTQERRATFPKPRFDLNKMPALQAALPVSIMSKGADMMRAMGWSDGQGVGKSPGSTLPVDAYEIGGKFLAGTESTGLGYKQTR